MCLFLSFDLLFFLFVQVTASKHLTFGSFSHPEQGSSQHASAFRPSPAQHTLKTQLWKGETTHLVAQKTSHLPGSLFRRYRGSEEQAFGRRPEPQTTVCGTSTALGSWKRSAYGHLPISPAPALAELAREHWSCVLCHEHMSQGPSQLPEPTQEPDGRGRSFRTTRR